MKHFIGMALIKVLAVNNSQIFKKLLRPSFRTLTVRPISFFPESLIQKVCPNTGQLKM